jgi:uncharacterized Ntn-hydrolase superfamily protein
LDRKVVAKLVTVSLRVRVFTDPHSDDEQVWTLAKPKLKECLDDAGMDNLESIEDDEECPYDSEMDIL